MEFDELLITTGVDALVRLVKEKQRIELDDASSILSIPQETIEEWARVLEEEGILRIEYRLTRIYLLWIKPTEEEVATEKQSFYEEKKSIESEVEDFRSKVSTESQDLDDLRRSFADFYAKAYARIDQLEKTIAPLPAAKMISEDTFSKYETELSGVGAKLNETRTAMDGIKNELGSLGISRGTSPSEELMSNIEKLNDSLLSIQQEMEMLRKKAAAEESAKDELSLPSVKDIKKKFETLQKDFTSLRSRNAQVRQDMLSLHESSEILKSVAESIMGQEDKIGDIRQEVADLAKETNQLVEKTNSVAAKVKQNVELVDRLGDSVDVAKGVLRKFPSQEKVLEAINTLKSEEDQLSEKIESLQKIIEAVGGKQVTARQYTEIAQKIDEKSTALRKEMDSLEATLSDEKNTYLTFQKIKERIVPSIESYDKQLMDMEARIAKIREESMSQMRSLKEDSGKLQESLKGGQLQGIVKVAEEIRDKKKTLDEIRSGLEEMMTLSDNLSKRVTLLSREAKLLEIRTGGGAGGSAAGSTAPGSGGGEGGGGTPTEQAIRQKLDLSKDEEMEFRKKREELKKLIQRLWEQ
jgi:chromosome segregation ATPase